MSTIRTTTQTSSNIGSIPVTAGHGNQPPVPTRPTTPSASDEERELEEQLKRNWERLQKLKEKRKAEEAAKKKAEEEAARQAAEERKAREEAAAQAIQARRMEEEAAEKRRRIAASARGRQGPAPGEASTSRRQMEVEIPRVVRKGSGKQSVETGDPDDGDDGSDDGDDEDEEDEKATCERCHLKKLPCLPQEGKRHTVICKPCHDSKVRCSYSGRPVATRREGGSGERLAVMESQLAQGLADVRSLREATTRTNQYLRQILRRQDKVNGRLIAIETRLSMAGSATPGPSRTVSVKPRVLKRRRVEEETEEEQEEEEKEKEVEVEREEGEEAPAPKKAKTVASEKGKEKEVE
ncbi:hypothetical protein F5876DRAFT_82854 [Lentinula aff. lateritia]|uniref:Uncharacterized protein n=1 Tax=Lentinula aff. lateritia TaxID=2804960 RepID=A0ACC1TIY7_9AGAR|nr:hypothetical protein F5876DRAFT_82854 [Lentinula aff. lateritia]